MKAFTILLFLFIGIGVIKPGYAFKKNRIIFYHIKSSPGISEEDRRWLKLGFENALQKNPKFDLVPADNLTAVFRRNGISEDGCTTTACAVKIGKDGAIGAKYAMYGELILNNEGLYLVNIMVVDIQQERIYWQPTELKRAKSNKEFGSSAFALVEELANTIPVEPRVKNISGEFVIIDVGSTLGIRPNKEYNVIVEEQFGLSLWDVSVDTVGVVRITDVNPNLSRAKVLSGMDRIKTGAKLIPMKKPFDQIPPTIGHNPIKKCGKFADLSISAEFSDNTGIKNAFLYYSVKPGSNFKNSHFTRISQQNNLYNAVIPKSSLLETSEIYYYIQIFDNAGNTRILKNANKQAFKVFVVSEDHVPPNISFERPEERAKSDELIFSVNVVDDILVKNVILYYKYEWNKPFNKLNLKLFGDNAYGGGIDISKTKTSKVYYFIEAEDYSGNKNYLANSDKPERTLLVSKDVIAPAIYYVSNLKRIDTGKYYIQARLKDNIAIKDAIFIYKLIGYGVEDKINIPLKKRTRDIFQAAFRLDEQKYHTVEFFIKVCDHNGNCASSLPTIERFNRSGQKIVQDIDGPSFLRFFPSTIGIKPMNYRYGKNLYYPIILRVKDNVGVAEAKLFVRNIGEQTYKEINISKLNNTGSFGDLVEGSDRGIEFYFKAMDVNNFISFNGSPNDPFRIVINRDRDKMADMPSGLRKNNK